MRKWFFSCILIVLALLSALLLTPGPIEPLAYYPPAAPALTGQYEANSHLANATRLAEGKIAGPEGVTLGPDGAVYSGAENGDILRLTDLTGAGVVEIIANTGGWPLGMEFDSLGNLIVADAHKGLLRVTSEGVIETLLTEVEGVPLGFPNDVAVSEDGLIYMSDSSIRPTLNSGALEGMEARSWGRLIQYDPQQRQGRVVLNDLYFPNGLTLAADESYLLFNETFRYRVQRLWLKGNRAGQMDTFTDNLPGFPDGISRGESGQYWLTLVAPRSTLLDSVHPRPWIKKLLAKLPESLSPEPIRFGFILALDETGKVIANLQDQNSEKIFAASSVIQSGNTLFIGTLTGDWIGRYDLIKRGSQIFP